MTKNKQNNKRLLYIFLHLPKNGGASLNRNLRRYLSNNKMATLQEIPYLSPEQKKEIIYIHGHGLYFGVHKYFPEKDPRYIVFIRNPVERRASQYNHDMHMMKNKKKPSFKKWYKPQIKDEQVFLCNKKFKGIPGRKAPKFTNSFITKFKVGNSKLMKMIGFKVLKLFYSRRNKKQELKNSKKLLEKSWFVGITENLDKDIPYIFNEIGIKGKIKRYRTANSNPSDNKKEVKKLFRLEKKTRKRINKDNFYDFELYNYAKKLNLNNPIP